MAFNNRIWTDDSNVLSATINFVGDEDVSTFQIDRGATVTAVTGITVDTVATTAFTVDGNTITFTGTNPPDDAVIAVTFTYTSNSLQFSNYGDVSTVTSNGRAFVVDNLSLLPTGIDNPGLRIDSGSLTIAEDEVIVTHQNQVDASAVNNAILVQGGTLIVEGSANENSPHTFIETMGNYASKASGNVHNTGSAALALVSGNITIGSVEKPFARIISHKNFTIDPGDINIADASGGASSLTIQTLILQNPIKDTILTDAQLPNLGFRGADAGYVTNGSSFDTAVLDGFNILDVSGADSANSGMFPQNIVFRRASLVGDNGGGTRANNLVGVAYAAVNGNTSAFDVLCNTNGNSGALLGANWFVLGNADGLIRATRRFNSQRGGFVSNRLITIDTASGATDQRYWLPETGQRMTDAAVTSATAITGATDLGGIQYNPIISDTLDTGDQIPINGVVGRYSLVNATPGTQLRLRTQMGWSPGGSGTSAPADVANTHQDGEYIYYGTQDLVIGTQAITYYTQGVVELEVSIPDATDPIIDVLKANSIATTPIAGAVVTLPALNALDTAGTTVALNEATATNVTMGQIFATIKSALVTRVGTGVNTTTEATAEQYVNNWLDKIVNATSPLAVSNTGAGAVELRSDNAYNNGVNTSQGSNVGGAITAGNNVTLQTTPALPRTFTIDSQLSGKYIIDNDGVLGTVQTKSSGSTAIAITTDTDDGSAYKLYWQPTNASGEIYDYTYAEWMPSEDPNGTVVDIRFDAGQVLTSNATHTTAFAYSVPATVNAANEMVVTITSAAANYSGDEFQTLNWQIRNEDLYLLMVADVDNPFDGDVRPNGFGLNSGVSFPTMASGNGRIRFGSSSQKIVGTTDGELLSTTIASGTVNSVIPSTQFLNVIPAEGIANTSDINTLGNQLKANQEKQAADIRRASLLQPATGTIPNTSN